MTTLSISKSEKLLNELVTSAATEHVTYQLKQDEGTSAVLISLEQFESMVLTLELLADPKESKAILEELRKSGKVKTFPLDEVISNMRASGRLR